MALLDFQTALSRLVPMDGGGAVRPARLRSEERACLDTLSESAGIRFTSALRRSWCARRAVNVGLLALSILKEDARRSLLASWINSGGGTTSFFATEVDALLEFIARQLPDPSPELAVCRFEQLTLRAGDRSSSFRAPDPGLFEPQRIARRAHHAGVVLFDGDVDAMLGMRPPREALPIDPARAPAGAPTALLVAPGLQPVWRMASRHERELWARLEAPAPIGALLEAGCPGEAIRTLLHIGALEYACCPAG
ncbi:MAG TPA: hypothetical protein VME42_07490 [Steroidobacteraceae bacterium]|nr:hypothetical protein [Steroidobacteraceae bacterium]